MAKQSEHAPVKAAEIIQVIHVQAIKGNGVNDSPLRQVDQYWSLDGQLLAETDLSNHDIAASDLAEP